MTRCPPNSRAGRLFGGRDPQQMRSVVGRVAFGQNSRSAERDLSLRSKRLRILAAELDLLFAYRIETNESFAIFQGDEEPLLILGRSLNLDLTIEIERQTGFYVLHEGGGAADCILITASEERLIDHVVSRVATVNGDLAPRTADVAIDLLIGRPLEDIERRAVLRTLHAFKGDHIKAAKALGLGVETLRARLRDYLRGPSRLILPENPQ